MLDSGFSSVAVCWEAVKKVLYDPLFIAIVAAGFATWAGARTAEKTAIKNSKREADLAEIRNINHAIMVAYSVANTMLVFKKQIILNLVSDYFEGRQKFLHDIESYKMRGVDEERRVISVKSNLIFFDAPLLPLDSLDKLIFEKISSGSRCLAATIQIREYYNNLTSAIKIRHGIIENKNSKLTPHSYYGIPRQGGVDNRYHDSIVGIKNYVDDLIFFSTVVCEDLIIKGNSAAKDFKSQHGKGAPLVDKVDFEMSYFEGLIPFKHNYKSWLSGFGKHRKRPNTLINVYLRVILIIIFVQPFISAWMMIDVALLLLMGASFGFSILR